MKKLMFIFNPRSGKEQIRGQLMGILDIFTKAGFDIHVHVTQSQKDCVEWVKDYAGRMDVLVVSGGDGTLNEAVTGMMNLERLPLLGYIPAGSTNDFAASLGLPKSMQEAAADIVEGSPYPIDIGRFCKDQYFVYIAGFGAFTEVSYLTPQDKKNWLGHNAYVLEVVKSLSSIKPYHIKVESEDQTIEGDYLYGMVSNTTSVGRFRNFPPGNPDLSDGLLEVTLISPVRDVKDVEELSRALLMTDPSILNSMLTTFPARKVKITAANELLWTLDGEAGGAHRVVEIEAVHNAYTILHGK